MNIQKYQPTWYDQRILSMESGPNVSFWHFLGQKWDFEWSDECIMRDTKHLMLAVILRCQPTWYDQRFLRYGIREYYIFFLTLFGQKGHFRWSDGYTSYETRIGKWLIQLEWGVKQLHTTNRTEEFEHFPKLRLLFLQYWDFWLSKIHFSIKLH